MDAVMIDIAFAIEAPGLPREHRRLLADALEAALPWLADNPHAGVHRINTAAGSSAHALLSRRARLTLRVPLERADEVAALAGSDLAAGAHHVRLGAASRRELLPHGTLYAHFVAADSDDELAFLRGVDAQLAALGVSARPICGRRQLIDGGALQGFGLMLDGLSPEDALRIMEQGLGAHRRLGCGIFVPHKSAAAVGSTR